MAEQNQQPEDEDLQAPEKLVEALNHLQKERIFVPQAVDHAMLMRARQHLRRLEGPQSGWKPWLSWAAMAACLALAVWLGVRFSNPTGTRPFAREDINRDGRVDVLDAFALARRIETGGTLDSRWDINGDGRVDRADVNAIAVRAVSLAQAGPPPKRSADLSPHRVGAMTVWRSEVRAPFFGLGFVQKELPDRRRISNKTTLTLTLSRPTGEGTARPDSRSFHSGWRRRPTHNEGSVPRAGVSQRLAECNSAIQQSTTLRYDGAPNRYPASCRQTLPVRRSQQASENREDRS